MLAFQQFGVGCNVNIAVKLVRGFHFHRVTRLNKHCKDVDLTYAECQIP